VQDKGNSLQLTNPLGQFQFALKHMPTMPKNMLRTVYLSGFLVLASHLGTPLEPIGAQEIPEKQFLFQTLGAFKTGEISEDQLRRLDAIAQGSSPFAKVAAQTVCLSKLQRGDYRGLWSAVSNASEGNSPKSESDANTPETMAWANERILLYFAIEAHRSEQAAELLKSAVKRSLDIPDQFVAHGRLDAAFLGALCALAKSDTAKDRIAPELVTKAMDLMSKHPHKSLSMAFEESYQVVAKHLGQLESSMSLVAGLSDKDLDAELSKAQMQFQNANGVYKEASEGLARGKKQSIAIDKDVQATRKLCAQIYQTLNTTEEPGRPKHPVKPQKPEGRTERDSKTGRTREIPPDPGKVATYQREYRQYLADMQSYPIRFAQWSARNEARQQRLSKELMESRTKLGGLEQSHKEQIETVRQLSASQLQEQQRFTEAQRHLPGVEFAREQRSNPSGFKGIYRPSLYRAIDWPAESDRLLKELQRR
jgi:hypothetical protein